MVQDDGKTYTLCAGRHFLHARKFYMGSSLGVGTMPDDCAAKVRKAGEAIGEATAADGYRGPLNVDFLYREADGALFPLEINPRRGLGGVLADMCICLFGQGYEKAVSAVAVHSLPVSNTITTYAQLRDSLLRKGFFGRESKGMVILPYSMSTLAAKSEFGLAVFGADGTSAEAALGEITGYLASRPPDPLAPGFRRWPADLDHFAVRGPPLLRGLGEDLGDPAEDLVDTLRDHAVHGLIDVEGVGDLRAVVRRGSQRDRGDHVAGDRHHEAVRLGHLVVTPGQRDLDTLGGDNSRLPGPPGPHVQHRRPRLGGQPSFEVAGLREDLPDPPARDVQGAGDGEFAHRNLPVVGFAEPRLRSGAPAIGQGCTSTMTGTGPVDKVQSGA